MNVFYQLRRMTASTVASFKKTYIGQAFANADIRKKLFITLLILAVSRLLANIPLPGVDMEVYQTQFGTSSTSEASYLLNLFTGGQLETPSIVGLGIGIYITASIMIQLLSSIIPKLEELTKEGERGKKLIEQYTRFLTFPLAIIYSLGYLVIISQTQLGVKADGSAAFLIPLTETLTVSPLKLAFMTLILAAGALTVMWLAELITEYGLGNGASLMIMIGIISGLPAMLEIDLTGINLGEIWSGLQSGNYNVLIGQSLIVLYVLILGLILLLAMIIFITESTRKLPIQYAARQRTGGSQESHLPLKLNQTGVMPIIFASALLTMPQLFIPLLQRFVDPNSPFGQFLVGAQTSFLFDTTSYGYMAIYFVFIVLFAIFYVFIAFKPEQVAENLQKSGGFVPGIRPGKSTEEHITKVLLRLTFAGSLFLGFIALIPIVSRLLLVNLADRNLVILSAIGGTSILIIAGVILETLRQIDSMRASQNYDKYIY